MVYSVPLWQTIRPLSLMVSVCNGSGANSRHVHGASCAYRTDMSAMIIVHRWAVQSQHMVQMLHHFPAQLDVKHPCLWHGLSPRAVAQR